MSNLLRKAYLLLMVISTFGSLSVSSQNITIERAEPGGYVGTAHGDNLMEFKGYRLSYCLEEVFDLPVNISMEADVLVNFKLENFKETTKEVLLLSCLKKINNTFDLTLSARPKDYEFFVAYQMEQGKVSECSMTDVGISSETKLINRTWIGKCVPVSKLFKQIELWYSVRIIDKTNLSALYNFEISDFSLLQLEEDLAFDYGIFLKKQNQTILEIYQL
jgi:hypothetical protein